MIVEFRDRSQRVPRALFPKGEVRLFVGRASGRRELAALQYRRGILRKVARRGQWEILAGIRDGQLTIEEVVRIVEESGLDTLHIETRDPGEAGALAPAVEEFLSTIDVRTTQAAYRTSLRRLVEHVGPDTPWDRVGRHEINELQDATRALGLSANTRSSDRTAWSAFYTWMIDRDESVAEKKGRPPRVTSHPVRKSRRVPVASTRHRFMSREELDRLIEVAPLPMRAQYLTLAFTGMRIGEFVSRRPEEVTERVIRIIPHNDWSPKGWPGYEHGVRDIPIEQGRLAPALEEYRERWAGESTFFVNPRTFGPWDVTTFRRYFRTDVVAAGMVYGRDVNNGVVVHTLRHSLASWLAKEDVQLMKIAKILGDTLATVAKYYAHLLPSDIDTTINRVLGPQPLSDSLTASPDFSTILSQELPE